MLPHFLQCWSTISTVYDCKRHDLQKTGLMTHQCQPNQSIVQTANLSNLIPSHHDSMGTYLVCTERSTIEQLLQSFRIFILKEVLGSLQCFCHHKICDQHILQSRTSQMHCAAKNNTSFGVLLVVHNFSKSQEAYCVEASIANESRSICKMRVPAA